MPKLVIVGAGMAAARLLKELVALNTSYEIEVIGEEPCPSYNRVLLSSLLADKLADEDISLLPNDWYRQHSISLHTSERVTAIDSSHKTLQTTRRELVTFDKLVLATGSQPFYPPLAGLNTRGVLAFRNQQDLEQIRRFAKTSTHAVVIGGGLLGLEAATGLLNLGVAVTVVNRESHLMPRQLDAVAASVLQEVLEEKGMRFQLGKTPTAINGDDNGVSSVMLDTGENLQAGMVLVTAGIVPNTELAERSGIPCQRGVLTNRYLETEIKDIYALGECCEIDKQLFGLVDPVYKQAAVLAARLNDKKCDGYTYAELSTRLKISGVQVVSAGDLSESDAHKSQVVIDRRNGVYRRLVFSGNKLTGFVLVGDNSQNSWYESLLESDCDVSSFKKTMMFSKPASPVAVTFQ